MSNEKILKFVREQMEAGMPKKEMKRILVLNGWSEKEVDEAIMSISSEDGGGHKGGSFGLALLLGMIAFFGMAFVSSNELLTGEYSSYEEIPVYDTVPLADDFDVEESLPASSVLDCGDDLECFVGAASTCEESSLDFTTAIDYFASEAQVLTHLTISPGETGVCNFSIISEDILIDFPLNATEDDILLAEENTLQMIGKEGRCTFERADLVGMLTRWSEGVFDMGEPDCELTPEGATICEYSGGDFAEATCTGDYFDEPLF